jgi:hypothetical protein
MRHPSNETALLPMPAHLQMKARAPQAVRGICSGGLIYQLARTARLFRIVRNDQSDDHICVDAEHPAATTASSGRLIHACRPGLKRDVSDASVLHTYNNRAVLKNREMNSIAGLEVRSGPHFFGDSRLTFAGNCCGRRIGLHPFLRLVILQGSRFGSSIRVTRRMPRPAQSPTGSSEKWSGRWESNPWGRPCRN